MYYLLTILLLIINYIFAKNFNLTIKKIRNTSKNEFSQIKASLERSHVDPCLLRCKDEYMFSTIKTNSKINKIEAFAIGSPLNLLIDLILSSQEENISPLERIALRCDKHNSFISCLRLCKNSIARQILADGQQAMNAICQSYLSDIEFKSFVLPCLSKNGIKVGKSCQLHWSLMESDVYETISQKQYLLYNLSPNEFDFKNDENEGFQRLCRAMNSYADCHLKTIAKLCHRRTIPFFVKFNAKVSAALLQMILDWFGNSNLQFDNKWTECEQWEPQKLLKSVLEEPKK
ncbi:hypothetical protein Mgra_00009655 [Meloidogyne graminicola]|uniref:CPG4 domain-containing protein n=1 Tax=Meloidogyne graminicola TaxID=189291 RepID=A0A8S9ZBQ4_9BILA|nr:hypothetical protein Mgra_00009655 [Meloidogyne graminicola]